MPKTNSDNQPLLKDFKTTLIAITHLKMDISAQEKQLSALITHWENSWRHSSYYQIDDLPPQTIDQLLDNVLFKKPSEWANTEQQYKNIRALAHQLNSMYQELEALEKQNEELEKKLMASGVTQEQLLLYCESEQLIAKKSGDKNQSKN